MLAGNDYLAWPKNPSPFMMLSGPLNQAMGGIGDALAYRNSSSDFWRYGDWKRHKPGGVSF